jgi:SAM-dependent methyltransferase
MSEYYDEVATYFDAVACTFEERYWENPVLHRMRQVFREETKRLPWDSALEVGCGTGMDLAHFASVFPDRNLVGIDLSPQMVDRARTRIESLGLGNASVEQEGVETMAPSPHRGALDLCYVFFGALNTTENLDRAADNLYDALRPGGHVVLTFVNRLYLAEILICLARRRWRRAFARLGRSWSGYVPERPLTSRCVGPKDVGRAFGRRGELVRRRGVCITYPAWYRSHLVERLGRAAERLWRLDEWLSRTPAWHLGEYTLYVYRKTPDAGR